MNPRFLSQELRRIVIGATALGTLGAGPADPSPAQVQRPPPRPTCVPAWEAVSATVPKEARLSDGGIDFGKVCELDGCTPTTCSAMRTDGGLVALCTRPVLCPGGRRPSGLPASASCAPETLPAFFSEAARLEAASIQAFRILERDLRVHGAPAELWRGARRAAADEVRHARLTRSLARRFGATPTMRRSADPPYELRSLEAVATENAVEGCARETYGALVALWQECHAADQAVSKACGEIAPDETRHAALAWQVDDWARAHLSPAAESRVQAAREAAFEQLKGEASHPVPAELERSAGIPSPTHALSLLAGLMAVDFSSARRPVA